MTIEDIKNLTPGKRFTVGQEAHTVNYIVDSNDGTNLISHIEGQEDPITWPLLGLERVTLINLPK